MSVCRFIRALVPVFLTAYAFGANADPLVLKFAPLNAATAGIVSQFQQPWAERISAQSDGKLKIEMSYGFTLANNANVFDRVENDAVQIAYGAHAYTGGRYPLTDVVSLPFVSSNSRNASVALWRLYEQGMLAAEYKDVKPLYMIVFPQQGIHTREKPINRLEDMAGMKVRIGAKVPGQIISALGAAPLSIDVGEMYEAMQRRTVQAVFMPWPAFQPFKLGEVTTFHLDEPLGTSSAMIFMSRKKYDGLPADIRAVIDANSGEVITRESGKWLDNDQGRIRDSIKADPKHTVSNLSHDELARFKAKLAPLRSDWVGSSPRAKAVFDAYQVEVDRENARGTN